jgi:hypothetical protein
MKYQSTEKQRVSPANRRAALGKGHLAQAKDAFAAHPLS